MHEPTAEVDEPGLVASALTLLRLIAGWSGAALGVLNLSMGVGAGDGAYLTFHIAVLVTGVGLLAIGLLPRQPDRVASLTGMIVGGFGLAVTALIGGGFPYGMGGFEMGHVISDVIFWGCVGFVVLVLVTQVRPASGTASGRRGPRHTTHAEGRTPAPDDENVGGLP
jgi:hypothetical protein